MIALILISLVAAPAWKISVPSPVASVGEIRFSTNFTGGAKAPPLTLVLMPEGGKPIRRPLPPKITVTRSQKTTWSVYGDLRHAFGRLKPGRYAFRLERPGAVSAPVKFVVIEATLAQALKTMPKQPGLAFTVNKGKGTAVLSSKRKADVSFYAYSPGAPGALSALVTAEYWNGRAWVGQGGGFCGTGLVQVKLASGASHDILLPPVQDGIVRFHVSCRAGGKEISVASNPVLIDTFKGK